MARTDDFPVVFEQLKALLLPYASRLTVTADGPGHYVLDTPRVAALRKVLFFGAVRTGTRYVSYHLMPVYVAPELLAGLSAPLRRRMQGQSCFDFTAVGAAALAELARLTERGFDSYRAAGYV